MSYEVKNQAVEEYIKLLAEQLNKTYPNIVDNEKITRASVMFKNSPKTLDEIKKEIDDLVEKMIESHIKMMEKGQNEMLIPGMERHYDLNDFIDCRISHNTLHIHVVPTDVKDDMKRLGKREYFDFVEERLEDALSKIPEVLKDPDNNDIKTVFAVSPLLKVSAVQDMFRKRGFDVEMTKNPIFYKMFNSKKIGEASITKEKFMELYDKTKEETGLQNNRDSRTFEHVKGVYKKVQDILDRNELKVYLSGGTVPYILQNEDSGRLHDDIDTICKKEDIDNLRELFKKEGFYKEEWDSKTYAKDGVDYGFEMMIDGVPYGIYPFSYNKGAKKITQYSFDPYTKECKQKTMAMEELSDYVMTYKGLDGKKYDTMSLEYIKLSKDNAGREKDVKDSKKIEDTNLLRRDVMKRITMFQETKKQPLINNDMTNNYYEINHKGKTK